MKKIFFVFAIGFLLISSCTGVKSVSSGLENESFLEFVGQPNDYPGGVLVSIDNKTEFNAEVNKLHTDRPKGKVYAISTGAHLVIVSYNNSIIFQKKIFISAQETKKIELQ